jgi:hypothetical protein
MYLLKSFNDRRVARGAAKATENNKGSQIQAGHDAKAWKTGQNSDWSTSSGQKTAEQDAVTRLGDW